MNEKKISDIVEGFIAGFGKRDNIDIHNGIFIAIKLGKLNLPLDFKGAGGLGVESPKLFRILRDAKPNQKEKESFHIGIIFSEFDSRELKLMASYLWNEGKNCLDENEKEEAVTLLQKRYGMTVEEKQTSKPSSAVASG